MFSGEIIAVAFIAVLVSANVLRFAEEIKWHLIVRAFTLILVIAGIYCFIAGAWMVGGWSDPLASMTAEEIDKVRPMSRGRGGILIVVIQFWPYVLMLTGAGSLLGAYGVGGNIVRSKRRPSMDAVKLDDDLILPMPFGKVMEVFTSQPEEQLIKSAMIGVAIALGGNPQTLSRDKRYHDAIYALVTRSILHYVEKAAAVQLGLMSLSGKNSTKNTFALFIPELHKVKNVVIPDKEAAEIITGNSNRTDNFVLAVAAMTALYCMRNPKVGQLFGLKKSFFGSFKYTG